MPNPLSVAIESGNLNMVKLIVEIFNSSSYDLVEDYMAPYDEAQTFDITNVITYRRFDKKMI